MTDPKQLSVMLTLPIDPPRPFIAYGAGHPDALAIGVVWQRTITDGRDLTRAVVYAEDGMNRSYYPADDDPIPDWVPQPAASWNAIVSDLAAEVLA